MGGVLIIISIVIPTLLWADLRDSYVWVALFGLVSYGAIGFFDDYAKILKHRNLGFTARKKLSAGVDSGSIRRWRRKPSSSASNIELAQEGSATTFPAASMVEETMSATSLRRARRRLASSGRRFSARAT